MFVDGAQNVEGLFSANWELVEDDGAGWGWVGLGGAWLRLTEEPQVVLTASGHQVIGPCVQCCLLSLQKIYKI